MTTLNKWMLAALAVTAVAGCDPFEKAIGGPPAVTAAGFSEGVFDTGLTGYPGTGSGSTWTATGVPAICSNTTPGIADAPGFIWVKFNKLLDGASIQNLTDCTAQPALNLAVTINGGGPPANQTWYACYNPQAPVPTESASVIIFLGPTATPPNGWDGALPIPASGTAVTTVHATGTAHDKDGAAAPFDVTIQINPDPAPGTPSFTSILPTSLTVDWTPACVPVNSYDLQRAPDNAGAPGAYATITTTPAGTTTFGDTGLTTGNTYWYRVVANITAGGTATSGEASTRTAPAVPAAPTFTNLTASSVTVNWTASVGATTYRVQRAPDVAGVPGAFVTRASNLVGLSFNDTGLTAATIYWYRIVAVNGSASSTGANASITTP